MSFLQVRTLLALSSTEPVPPKGSPLRTAERGRTLVPTTGGGGRGAGDARVTFGVGVGGR